MPKWIGVITNDGNKLLGEWVNEKTLSFDKVMCGTGTVATEAMMAQGALVNQKQVAAIVGSEQVDSGIRLKIQITAADVSYELNQIGVWASVENAEPVMLALYQYTTGVPVPSKAESQEFVYTFYALISTSNQGQWTVNVNTSALVTREQLDSHIENKNNPHGMTCEQLGAASEELVDEISALASANADAIREHINNTDNPHGMSIDKIGAAPAGYGLGTVNPPAISDLNTCKQSGWYYTSEQTLNVSSTCFKYASVFVSARTSKQIVQRLVSIGHSIKVEMLRYTEDGGATWIEEWITPPMAVGVEYRTTERSDGKPVYVKRISVTESDISALGSGVNRYINHGISGFGRLVRCNAVMDQAFPLPHISYRGSGNPSIISINNVNMTTIAITAINIEWSAPSFTFDIYYCKQ